MIFNSKLCSKIQHIFLAIYNIIGANASFPSDLASKESPWQPCMLVPLQVVAQFLNPGPDGDGRRQSLIRREDPPPQEAEQGPHSVQGLQEGQGTPALQVSVSETSPEQP